MAKPTIYTEDFDGNIYSVLGAATQALRNNGQKAEANELKDLVFKSKGYGEAVGKILQYVDIESRDDDDDELEVCENCGNTTDELMYCSSLDMDVCTDCFDEYED